MSSKELSTLAKESYKHENRQIPLNCKIHIKKNEPVSISVTPALPTNSLYKDLKIEYQLNDVPIDAKNKPLEKQTVITQIAKTSSTPYQFKNINVDLDENVFLPKLSTLNELRRTALEQVEAYAIR